MKRHLSYTQLYLMALPALLYFFVFSVYPLVQGFWVSLQEPLLLGGGRFVGLENYRAVLDDPAFWRALQNTLFLGGGMLAVGVLAPLALAVLLHEAPFGPLRNLTQSVTYTPHLFSWVVVGGIWIQVLAPDGGLVNGVITAFGGKPIHFLAETTLVKPLFVMLAGWKELGYNAVIYYAAISALDPTLYEAATVDGARRWQRVRFITLPLLRPTVTIVLVLTAVGVLRMFDQIFVLRNAATTRSVDVVMTYVYDRGIAGFRLGEAAAASFLVVAVGLVMLLFLRRVLRVDRVDG